MIEVVPQIFQTLTKVIYPPHNKMVFEEYFMNYFIGKDVQTSYTYLPVMWTNFYIERKYGTIVMDDLQKYLDGLDRNKKYFTVIQYDDGILQNIDDLNIFIFGAGGGGIKTRSVKNLGYPIPLICLPTPNVRKNREKNIFCSFIGSIKNSPMRRKIKGLFDMDFVVMESVGYKTFVDAMERSVFSLCPRGYGATSFRICEALQHGSIPVYIYDTPWIPWKDEFDFNDIGILIPESEIPNILKIIQSKTKEDIERYVRNGEKIYEEYFTFSGCSQKIIDLICS
jgi:glycosyltransferase involved in cell wall biosynthesis